MKAWMEDLRMKSCLLYTSGAITIYKEGEVLSLWNGSNFTYEKKKLSGAASKVTAGADIYKADGTKVYSAGDVGLQLCIVHQLLGIYT